jgi:hypothetical protein
MALHDDNSSVATKDRCHELAWTLDAGIMNGRLTEKHLNKLEKYFEEVKRQALTNHANLNMLSAYLLSSWVIGSTKIKLVDAL